MKSEAVWKGWTRRAYDLGTLLEFKCFYPYPCRINPMKTGIRLSYSAYVCRCLKTYTHFNIGYRRAYFCGTKMQCTLCNMKFTRKTALIVWTRLFGIMKPYLSSVEQGIVTFSCTGALKVSTFMGRRQWIYQMECCPEVLLDRYFLKHSYRRCELQHASDIKCACQSHLLLAF
jgi:hypothetical protein